jgi:hypothetical protein
MADDIPPPPFVYEGLDPVPASKSTIEEVSDAVRGAASRATRVPVGRPLARCRCGPASLKQQRSA